MEILPILNKYVEDHRVFLSKYKERRNDNQYFILNKSLIESISTTCISEIMNLYDNGEYDKYNSEDYPSFRDRVKFFNKEIPTHIIDINLMYPTSVINNRDIIIFNRKGYVNMIEEAIELRKFLGKDSLISFLCKIIINYSYGLLSSRNKILSSKNFSVIGSECIEIIKELEYLNDNRIVGYDVDSIYLNNPSEDLVNKVFSIISNYKFDSIISQISKKQLEKYTCKFNRLSKL